MKKLKFLTSLSALGVLTTAAPIVMTSCSDSSFDINIDQSASDLVYKAGGMIGCIYVSCTKDDKAVDIKSIYATTASDKIEIDNKLSSFGLIIVNAKSNWTANDTANIVIKAEDTDGNTKQQDVKIVGANHVYWTAITHLPKAPNLWNWLDYTFLYLPNVPTETISWYLHLYDGDQKVTQPKFTLDTDYSSENCFTLSTPQGYQDMAELTIVNSALKSNHTYYAKIDINETQTSTEIAASMYIVMYIDDQSTVK